MKLPKFLTPSYLAQSGPLGQKHSRANRLIVLGLGSPEAVPHADYKALSKESYERNITIFRCVNVRAAAIAPVPWVLYRRGKAVKGIKAQRIMTKAGAQRAWMTGLPTARKALETTEITDHPMLSLLEKPNPVQGQTTFRAEMVSYYLLSGNSYEEFVAPNRKDAPPLEIYNLRPDRTSVLPNNKESRAKNPEFAATVDVADRILGYEYSCGDAPKPELFTAKSVLHRKFFHPTNDFYGLSPLQVAFRAVRTDNTAQDWNHQLLKHEARPSGVLLAPGTVADDTYERLKTEIMESWTGSELAGMPLFLEGGLKWEQLGLAPADLDFLEGRKFSRVELCAALGVPPELIGDAEHKTYNSFPEARMSFWEETNLPTLDGIRDDYNNRLTPLYGDDLFLDYDRDAIEAIQEDRAKLWIRLAGANWLSVNQKLEATGYETFDEDPMADVPMALVPGIAGGASNPTPPADPTLTGDNRLKQLDAANPFTPEDTLKIKGAYAVKDQRLTAGQVRQRGKIRRLMKDYFKSSGEDIAARIRKELEKL